MERLEGRDVPSSLDVTTFGSPPTDSATTSDAGVISQASATAPQSGTTTAPVVSVVVLPALTTAPTTTAPQAGDTLPPPSSPPVVAALAAPTVTGWTESEDWTYTVNGTLPDPNPAALTVLITVDGTAEPPAKVTPLLNPDGTPSGVGTFSATFGLPACTSATNCMRYGSAVATDGTRTSPLTPFTIEQTPHVASSITTQ